MSKSGTKQKARLGFIGAGFIGQVAHISNFRQNDLCELVAICEAKPLLRARVKQHYGFLKEYESHLDLLNDSSIDAVVAITRRQNTGPVALDVLRAGKHLLTEKPMCHSVAQANTLVEESRKQGNFHFVGYMRRHDEGVAVAKRVLGNGSDFGLGKLLFVRGHCYGGDSYCGIRAQVTTEESYPTSLSEWALAPEWVPKEVISSYASFINVFCHDVNLLRYCLGMPRIISTNLKNLASGEVRFDFGEFEGVLETGSKEGPWDEYFEFNFESGKLRVDLPAAFLPSACARVSLIWEDGSSSVLSPKNPHQWAFRNQADAFVKAILAGSPPNQNDPLAPASDALEDIKLIEEIWRMELRIPFIEKKEN